MAKLIFSAVSVFLYIGGGSFAGSIFLLRRYDDKPDFWIIVACLLMGLGAAIKDIRANLNMPLIDNSTLDALNQLKQLVEKQNKNEK